MGMEDDALAKTANKNIQTGFFQMDKNSCRCSLDIISLLYSCSAEQIFLFQF